MTEIIERRIIPVLTIDRSQRLVKTTSFKKPRYIGDPINALKIFNEKGADEVALLDIDASRDKREPNFDAIAKIAAEAFMPMAYGGGINSIKTAKKIFSLGVEKIVLSTAQFENEQLLRNLITEFGAQSIVLCLDIRRTVFNKIALTTHSGSKKISRNYSEYLQKIEKIGPGEIYLNFINQEGTYQGYDTETIKDATAKLSAPVVAIGGAGSTEDFKNLFKETNCSGAGASSIFIFAGKNQGVLISYTNYLQNQ